jgi:hypothetical protein
MIGPFGFGYDYDYGPTVVEGLLNRHVNLSEVGTDPNRDARTQKCRQATFVLNSVWDLYDGRSGTLAAGTVGSRSEAERFVAFGTRSSKGPK